jgi:opacity protein-like surface antigen
VTRIQMTVGLLAVSGVAALVPGSAAAQSELGPYLALGLGFDKMPDRDLAINGHTVNSQWKNGWGFVSAIGYKWFFGLRTEGEFSGRVSWVKTFNHVNPWTGTQWDNSVMFNALYDFEFGWPITPYIGGGLGGTQIQWGNNFRVPTQATPTIYDAESIRLGWQGIAGLTFAITPALAVAADYRIKGAFGGFGFPGSVAGKDINQFHYETRSVFLSVRYFFGA